jgi:hypothetical protein
MVNLASRLDRVLRGAGLAISGVSIGTEADRQTWKVFPVSLQDAAQPIIDTFDPNDPAVVDAELDDVATSESDRKDVLATCALVAKYTDPTGWAAMTLGQKVTRVRALAADWKTFRIFVEKNL